MLRVLFIDDNQRLIKNYVEQVERAGFSTRRFRGVDQALHFLRTEHNAAEVIVWDMMMAPGIEFQGQDTDSGLSTGKYLYLEMRKLQPGAHYLLFTGRRDVPFDNFRSPENRSYVRSKEELNPQGMVELLKVLVSGNRPGEPQVKETEEKLREAQVRLSNARDELDSSQIPRDEIRANLEVLLTDGTIDDIGRIAGVISRMELDNDTLEFASEVKRQLQERSYLLAEIIQEEQDILSTRNLVPRDPRSRWLAVRRGTILAEAVERAEVEEAITGKQEECASYVALVVPVGNPLPSIRERR
jgi:hypothetical protein